MRLPIEFTVNGQKCGVLTKPNQTLLEVLRDELKLKGVKEGCGMGVCGACTVILDGKTVSACLTLAVRVQGAQVQTIEGLVTEERLHPLQEAFINKGAFQCGFCTPGMILTAKSLLKENPHPTEEEIKDYMAGNLCRCTGYKSIIEAIQAAAGEGLANTNRG